MLSARVPLVALPLLAALACQRASDARPAAAVAGQRYTVRAEVVALPPRPGDPLMLRHEPIPDFVDRSGAVVGMRAMVMPFPVSAEVPLAGLAPGDKIRFTLSVDWAQGRYLVERIERLPPETALETGPSAR